jgi:aryl-alcohol dehydrogenase
MFVKAAVLRDFNAPLSIEELTLDSLQHDEVLVRVVATGICQTDIAMTRGFPVPVERPFVLGHEGAGIIEAVGTDVAGIEQGAHVVLSFQHCNACKQCHSGHAAYCEKFFVNFSGRRSDGSPTLSAGEEVVGGNFFGQSSFSTYAIAKATSVVEVTKEIPLDILGPLGCGIMTGAGAVMNVLKPEPGSSVAVFGAGAVGLSALMAARVMGCTTLIAVDLNDERLALAKELGATHTINAAQGTAAKEIIEITGGGVNYAVEASGAPPAISSALDSLAVRGACSIVGGGPPIPVNMPHLMTGGRMIKGVGMGDAVPAIFIPTLIDLYRQGRFPFDRLIRFYSMEDVNQAIADAISGLTVKPVIRM